MKYWNKTINLLLKTNNFYKKAKKIGLFSTAQSVNEYGGYSSGDDDSPDSESPVSQSPISEIPDSVGNPGEDLGTFKDLKYLANTINNKNPDVANQIDIIAQLLKIAIRNNKGYSYVMNALNNFVAETLPDNYPEDDEDDEDDDVDESKLTPVQKEVRRAKQERFDIEMMMNKTSSDIKKRAVKANIDIKRSESPEVIKQMRAAKLDFEAVLEQKDRNLNDRSDTGYIDPNQKQIATELKDMGINVEESTDTTDIADELGFGTGIDASDIAGKRPRDGGGAPGMGVRSIHQYKDYIEFYNEEISKYTEDLSETQNEKSRSNLIELIKTLESLKDSQTKFKKLSEDITWTTYPATEVSPAQKIIDQPELKDEYDSIRNELRTLGRKRSGLIQRIKSIRLNKDSEGLEKRYNTSRSEKEKFLIEQLILLNDLRASTDLNKGPEIAARKQLIEELKGNASLKEIEDHPARIGNIPPDKINSLLEIIKQTSLLKTNRKQYNLNQTIKNKELINAGREFADIPGLIKELTQHIPNIKMGDKKEFFLIESKRIVAEANAEELTLYKPYIEAVIAAKKSNNKKLQAETIKQLASALNKVQEKFVKLKEQMEKFDIDHQDITFWRKSLDLSNKKGLFKKENLSNEDLNEFKTLILTGQLLLENNLLRKNSIIIINNLIHALNERYNQIAQIRVNPQAKNKVRVENISPDTGEVTIEEMSEEDALNIEPSPLRRIIRNKMSSKHRKNILKKIANESLQNKMVDSIMSNNSLESITDPERYAHEVFQEMLEIIKNNNQLD